MTDGELAAEMAVGPLVASCEAAPLVAVSGATVDTGAACGVLKRWDRKANLDSVGAVLFREFWRTAKDIPNVWATPFNPADPVNTPRDLNTASPAVNAALLQALAQTVRDLAQLTDVLSQLKLTPGLSAVQRAPVNEASTLNELEWTDPAKQKEPA